MSAICNTFAWRKPYIRPSPFARLHFQLLVNIPSFPKLCLASSSWASQRSTFGAHAVEPRCTGQPASVCRSNQQAKPLFPNACPFPRAPPHTPAWPVLLPPAQPPIIRSILGLAPAAQRPAPTTHMLGSSHLSPQPLAPLQRASRPRVYLGSSVSAWPCTAAAASTYSQLGSSLPSWAAGAGTFSKSWQPSHRLAVRAACSLTDVDEEMPPPAGTVQPPLPLPPAQRLKLRPAVSPSRATTASQAATPDGFRPVTALRPSEPASAMTSAAAAPTSAPASTPLAASPVGARSYSSAASSSGSDRCSDSPCSGTADKKEKDNSGAGPSSMPPSPMSPSTAAEAAAAAASRVVSEQVERQRKAPAAKLDPVGAADDRQRAAGSDPAAVAATRQEGPTRGSPPPLPPVDHVRPPPRQDGDGQECEVQDDKDDKKQGGNSCYGGTSESSAAGAGSEGNGWRTGEDGGSWLSAFSARRFNGDGRPSWMAGPTQTVSAVPCSTVGYGSRAEVVARLPASIMLLRHAECMTLDDLQAHERVPNHDIPLSPRGVQQARLLGARLRPVLQAAGMHMYMVTSPFLRCSETTRLLAEELAPAGLVSGCREAVQLREQDWGNFQEPQAQAECKQERLRYGRFYYRFPSGESVADVYDRLTIFQDHLVRDMCAGRFSESTCVAIVSHGLTLRVFAMRWLHWTVRQFLQVYNIPNAEPVMLHKDVEPFYLEGDNAHLPFMPHHTKCLYRLTPRALELLPGADPCMATSSGCWQGQLLQRPAGPREGGRSSDDDDRQWLDVDGMA